MPLDHAVALLADGRTATMLLRAAAVAPGERVLVEAAAGGVGTQLVQLAKAAGAVVVAAASSEAKLALARSLGADEVVDYTRDGWAAGPYDVVFDGVGGDIARAAFAQLAAGGRMLSYGLASGSWAGISADEAAARGVTLVQPDRSPAALRSCTESILAAGTRAIIGQRFPLERAADAHAAIESRATLGKTLLERRTERQRATYGMRPTSPWGWRSYPPTPPSLPQEFAVFKRIAILTAIGAAALVPAVAQASPAPPIAPVKPLQVKWILGPGQTTEEYPTMYGYETVELDDPSYPGPRVP